MKTFNWTKLPERMIMNQPENIWKEILEQGDMVVGKLNFKRMEELFCQKVPAPQGPRKEVDKKSKEPVAVTLLDGKRSMNVSIALHQLKMSPKEIVNMLKECRGAELGAEKLRMLLKALPESDELSVVKSYTGDPTKLGIPEQFYLELTELEQFSLYVTNLLHIEEFLPNVESLEPQLIRYSQICRTILESKKLQDFFGLILAAGNFINCGSYAGNASGFRLNTLSRLLDTRANKPGTTLLHFLVEEAENREDDAFSFLNELSGVGPAARLSLDTARSEIVTLRNCLNKMKSMGENPTTAQVLKNHLSSFVQSAQPRVAGLESIMRDVDVLAAKVATHFCEDPAQFNIEECVQLFATFCSRIRTASKENMERKKVEERAERIRKSKELAIREGRHRYRMSRSLPGSTIETGSVEPDDPIHHLEDLGPESLELLLSVLESSDDF
ncbi:FH2 domain-containing protein 1-like isoform X2 [Varroa jacobsoni]|uniref:FH2 domain-containing protein 1-like isoform X2 n=1 Tax=Varroa jacobsoni TaxID=62625 RepID=UPI000BF7311B|nr:FH2 domain-containing protein 1-like isoform X2 [Varroa jacobsoni]